MKHLFMLILPALLGTGCDINVNGGGGTGGDGGIDLGTPDQGPHNWTGHPTDLLVADAWAACSFASTDLGGASTAALSVCDIVDPLAKDPYMAAVLAMMNQSSCSDPNALPAAMEDERTACAYAEGYAPNALHRWYYLRSSGNCSPNTTPVAVPTDRSNPLFPVRVPGYKVNEGRPTPNLYANGPSADATATDQLIRGPGINLCIAQALRSHAPFTSMASIVSNSDMEQRHLMEVTRQRATAAVMGYAQLAAILAQTNTLQGGHLAAVQAWGQDTREGAQHEELMREIGANMAAAAQLATITAAESFEMMSRNASARLAHGISAEESYSEAQWGPGAWRARALSALYGGNPFFLGEGNDSDSLAQADFDWPLSSVVDGPDIVPIAHPTLEISEPQVRLFERLARQNDAVEVIADSLTDRCLADPPSTELDNATAKHLYRTVEAQLRTEECREYTTPPSPVGCGKDTPCTDPGTCRVFTETAVEDPDLGIQNFSLWHKYGIRPNHALTFGQMWRRALACGFFGERSVKVLGSITSTPGPAPHTTYHVDRQAELHPASLLEEHEGLYSVLNGKSSQVSADLTSLSAEAAGYASDSGAFAGTVPALAGLRRGLDIMESSANASTANIAALLEHSADTKHLIADAAGAWSMSVEPQPGHEFDSAQPRIFTIYTPSDDPFWTGSVELLIYQQNELIPSSLLDPRANMNDYETTDLVAHVASTATTLSGGLPLKRWSFGPLSMQYGWTIGARNSSGKYRLLVQAAPWYSLLGGHVATGGALNTAAARMLSVDPENPSRPLFDGLGLPNRLSPPSDPTLVGVAPGQASYTQYLQSGKDATAAATTAVSGTFSKELGLANALGPTTPQANPSLGEQTAESSDILVSIKRQFCGERTTFDKDACDPTLTSTARLSSASEAVITQLQATCNNAGLSSSRRSLACAVQTMLSQFDTSVQVPGPVVGFLGQSVDPSFPNYRGGSLEAQFGQTTTNYRKLQTQIGLVAVAQRAVDGAIDAASTSLTSLPAEVVSNCSPSALTNAWSAGWLAGTGFPSRYDLEYTPSLVIAQLAKCRGFVSQLTAGQAHAIFTLTEAVGVLAQETLRLTEIARALDGALAASQQAAIEAGQAISQVRLDNDAHAFVGHNALVFNRYYSKDLWQARSLVEEARRHAAIARHAIESYFVADLSTMNQPEPFVPAPGLWSDRIFTYDFNLVDSVGMNLVGSGAVGGVDSLGNYISTLEQFVHGFVVARPSVVTHSDSEVISLPGPAAIAAGLQGTPGAGADSRAATWSFECPNGSWAGIPLDGNLNNICGANIRPLHARVQFLLDSTGQVNGAASTPGFEKRYNERFGRIALNLVGTGILNCQVAADPQACYSEAFVRYDLSHVGATTVIDHDGLSRWLDVPSGQIESAKALTAEQWLDPLSNAWGKPYVTQVARTELVERPLSGTYELILQIGPELVLSRIEQVQLLAESSYWVKQD